MKAIKSDSDSDSDDEKKRSPGFSGKIEGRHPQLPPRVSPTLVTPLLACTVNCKSHSDQSTRFSNFPL